MNLYLFLAWLEEETNPVGVVVHGEVSQPGASVGVHADFIALFEVEQDGGSSHGVLMIIFMILIKNGSNLFTIHTN